MRLRDIYLFAAAAVATIAPTVASAQTAESQLDTSKILIEPLFQYPIAPESITDLTGKSNYLMEHFWDAMDFKSKAAVDQNALNDAFSVYVTPMQWADKEVTLKSIDNLIANYSKSPTLMIQFTKAAEENLYSDRAHVWIDEVYIKFLEAIAKNKKLSDSRKLRYQRQLTILNNSQVGNEAKSFKFTSPVGNEQEFRPGLLSVIEFGDPDCDNCRHSKLKMETNVAFSQLVERGVVSVLFIVPDADEGWQTQLAGYSNQWHVGASDSVSDIYDIRLSPTFYVIGTDGKIIAKNISVDKAMSIAAENVK